MNIICQNDECSAPESRCKRGLVFADCPDYQTPEHDHSISPGGDGMESDAERLPWSGDALSLATLSLASGLRRPYILAFIGLPDAGKTSLLTTIYARLRRETVGGRAFSGSMTLRGWEMLHRNLKWRPEMPPTYPARTSSAQREPGFLHLALRSKDDRLIDVLLADTPGEWFQTFARDANVSGAQVTLDLADGLLLVIDPTSLIGARRHATRSRLTGLVRRVQERAPTKPLVLMLSRADQQEAESAELNEVLDLIATLYPGHRTLKTISAFEAVKTALAGQGALEGVDALLNQLEMAAPATPPVGPREPLLALLIQGAT